MAAAKTTGSPRKLQRLGCVLEIIHGLASARVLEHMASALHGGEMSFSQLNALHRIYVQGPQTIAELALSADLSHTAASRMVERLVQAGLVVRREALQDRRRKQVELTGAGVEKLECLRRLTAISYAELLRPLPAKNLQELHTVLTQVEPLLARPSPYYQTKLPSPRSRDR